MAKTWAETLEAKGQIKGAHTLLLHVLAMRFGPLPEGVQRKVETINSWSRLNKLAERVLSAHSLEEMGLV
ncbi:MAG TPA: hypothetical protein VF173_35980 [Thermoanaerobaculia bacterium]|nr:hypothetical protein [Thermoanaerobaculia bacterium]